MPGMVAKGENRFNHDALRVSPHSLILLCAGFEW
jgi:hypothetical protein